MTEHRKNNNADRKFTHYHTFTEHPDAKAFERHCHSRYELLYVVQGEGVCRVEGSEYPLQAGRIFLFRPNEYHYVCPSREHPYERYVIHFSLSTLPSSVRALPMLERTEQTASGLCFSQGEYCRQATVAFERLDVLNRCKSGSTEWDAQRTAFAEALLTEILLLLSLEESDIAHASTEDLVSRVMAYIDRHLTQPILLEETAKRFFVNKYYLCRIFHQRVGVSFVTYLNTKRIAMAQALIAEGVPASEAALRVGYGDYSSFYRAFCKIKGHSPKGK